MTVSPTARLIISILLMGHLGGCAWWVEYTGTDGFLLKTFCLKTPDHILDQIVTTWYPHSEPARAARGIQPRNWPGPPITAVTQLYSTYCTAGTPQGPVRCMSTTPATRCTWRAGWHSRAGRCLATASSRRGSEAGPVRERNTAVHCASAASLPKTDTFACVMLQGRWDPDGLGVQHLPFPD